MASFTVTFENNSNEEFKGCALEIFNEGGARIHLDGVRPVEPGAKNMFRFEDCSRVHQWRFLASLAYSDNPDDLRTVLVDTGKRAKTKCEYTLTFAPSPAFAVR
ncbi:MAG: hypothetical protein NTY08_10045 [Proteobacteria bacterium]|nr:hypothetical protein [Pseudomonadota bacterium]